MIETINLDRLSLLADKLIGKIKIRKDFFNPLKIIFPNIKVQQWFKAYWLKHEDSVLMNVDFECGDNAFIPLIKKYTNFKIVKNSILQALIIKHFYSGLKGLEIPDDIKNYIEKDCKIDSTKIHGFSLELANLFIAYDNDCFEATGWQRILYERIKCDLNQKSAKMGTLKMIRDIEFGGEPDNKETVLFGFNKYSNIQKSIIDSFALNHNVYEFVLEKPKTLGENCRCLSVPSKLKEIEVLHSLILNEIIEHDTPLSDFVVYSTNLKDYETEISRIFNQDKEKFPNIPYSLNFTDAVENDSSKLFDILYHISIHKSFTRLDLANVIDNPLVRLNRNITDDDARAWKDAILKTNSYRNCENNDDWEYLKKRIILSKVVSTGTDNENIISLDDDNFLSYSSIGLDNDSIVKFINIIDDLKSWIDFNLVYQYVYEEKLDELTKELNKWFVKSDDENAFNKDFYYVANMINFWKVNNVSNNNIPMEVLLYNLKELFVRSTYSSGGYFSNGITFSDFNINSVLDCKHVYFIGASSKNLPKKINKSELDQRKNDPTNNEDLKESFFKQSYNTDSEFVVSFVSLDLKKDEEFFPSSFILDLKKCGEDQCVKEADKFDLDETRDWKDLFTNKEFKDKEYFNLLNSTKIENKIEDTNTYIKNKFKNIRVKDFANLIKDPLYTKSSLLFGNNIDEDEEIETEYEPINFDSLAISNIFVDVVKDLLNGNKDDKALKEMLRLQHKLPYVSKEILDKSFESIKSKAQDFIKEATSRCTNFGIIKLPEHLFKTNEENWILNADRDICRSDNKGSLTYFEIKQPFTDSEIKLSEYAYSYIYSLFDISLMPEKNYSVNLIRIGSNKDKNYNITPSEAKNILNNLYLELNNYDDTYFLPIDCINSKINNFYDLSGKINNVKPWTYTDDKKMFDKERDFGYTIDNFGKQFDERKAKILSNVKFVK